MKDLARCLGEYPAELLYAIADVWGLDRPDLDERDGILALATGMSDEDALARIVDRLSPEGRRLLADIQLAGGSVPSGRVTMAHGTIRRLGPARMAREMPWTKPENPLEELYYRGLLHRAYGQIGRHYGEIYFLPQQVFDALPPLDHTPLAPASTPQNIRCDGMALSEDLLALLAHLRLHRVAAPPDGEEDIPESVQALARSPRFAIPCDSERLRFLWCMAHDLGFVGRRRGRLQPTLKARDWLQLDDGARLERMWRGWIDDQTRDELRALPAIVVRRASPTYSPPVVRKRLMRSLCDLDPERWYSLASWVRALEPTAGDLLRQEGDLDWDIVDARNHETLNGPGSWPHVEGVLARAVLQQVPVWMGAVCLDADEGEAFLLTARGQRLLAHKPLGPQSESDASTQAIAQVDADLTVTIRLRDTAYERYQLERFAEWRQQETEAIYCITQASLWHSLNQGITEEQIEGFLRRTTGDRVPLPAIGALRAWAAKYGRANLRRAVLLTTDDPDLMQRLRSTAAISGLLGEQLSLTMCVVPNDHVAELVHQLKDAGIWPRVQL